MSTSRITGVTHVTSVLKRANKSQKFLSTFFQIHTLSSHHKKQCYLHQTFQSYLQRSLLCLHLPGFNINRTLPQHIISELNNYKQISRFHVAPVASYFSSPSRGCHRSDKDILSFSTILKHDGADMYELPVLIRHSQLQDSDSHAPQYQASNDDLLFFQQLENCRTVPEFLKQLEVPDYKLSAFSATFALHRLSQLKKNSTNDMEYYIRRDVFLKLCDQAKDGLSDLTNSFLLNLVESYLLLSHFSDEFCSAVNIEVEKRISSGVFSIQGLCWLIRLISNSVHSDLSLASKAWIHTSERSLDLNETNLGTVYECLRWISPKDDFIWRVLDSRFGHCYDKFTSASMAAVMQAMSLGNHCNISNLEHASRWLKMNTDKLANTDFAIILGTFSFFEFSNQNIYDSLEYLIQNRHENLTKNNIASVMDFLKQNRYLSQSILDLVAKDLEKNGHLYEHMDLQRAVRPFGQLNYAPSNLDNLFLSVEKILVDRFRDFDLFATLEIVASFMYLNRFSQALNLKLLNKTTVQKLQEISDVRMQRGMCELYLQLQCGVMLQRHLNMDFVVSPHDLNLSVTSMEGVYQASHTHLGTLLCELLGSDHVQALVTVDYTPYVIDYEVCVSGEKRLAPIGQQCTSDTVKLAFVIVRPELYVSNTGELMGQYATKHRHLQLLLYEVIQIDFDFFMTSQRGDDEKREHLIELMRPYVEVIDNKPHTTHR